MISLQTENDDRTPLLLEAPTTSDKQQQKQQQRRWRSALTAVLAIGLSRIAQNGFAPLLSELLLSRACVSLGLPPYPDKLCEDSDQASSAASIRSGYFNLATTIPGIVMVGFFAMLSDARGRKITLVMVYFSQLLQFMLVWLLPAGRVCLLPGGSDSLCVSDSFWILLPAITVLSALGGDSLSLSLAAVADATEGLPDASTKRSMLFGLVEAVNMGGGIVGPLVTGYLADRIGLQQSVSFAVVGMGLALFCVVAVFAETLPRGKRKPFRWAAANPLGSAGMLLRHPILVRFLLILIFVDLANNQSTTLYFTRLSGMYARRDYQQWCARVRAGLFSSHERPHPYDACGINCPF